MTYTLSTTVDVWWYSYGAASWAKVTEDFTATFPSFSYGETIAFTSNFAATNSGPPDGTHIYGGLYQLSWHWRNTSDVQVALGGTSGQALGAHSVDWGSLASVKELGLSVAPLNHPDPEAAVYHWVAQNWDPPPEIGLPDEITPATVVLRPQRGIAGVISHPFRLDGGGGVTTIEQSGSICAAQTTGHVLAVRQGERPLAGPYGLPDPVGGIDDALLLATLADCEPEVSVLRLRLDLDASGAATADLSVTWAALED